MHSTAWPDAIDIGPGEGGMISVAITNTTDVIDAYSVDVFGLDPSWVVVEPPVLSLFPGDTDNVSIKLQLPEDYPSSHRTLSINVTSHDDPGDFRLTHVELAVKPQTHTSVAADPVMVTSGRKATFGLVVSNEGNAAVRSVGFAIDPEALAEFTFVPDYVVVAPGTEQVIRVTAKGGRAWFGQLRARTFTLGVDAEERVETVATFIQRPRIGRWVLSLLALMTAALIFGLVIRQSFGSVVDEAKISDNVLEASFDQSGPAGVMVPTDPGGVTGTVNFISTQEGLTGVQAELFVSDDTTAPIKTAATDADGSFTIDGLNAGMYKLRLSGAGVGTIWYPAGQTPAEADEITVELGKLKTLGPIDVGGLPVEVSGQLDVDDPTDVTLTLLVPGPLTAQLEPDATGPPPTAVVAQVSASPDGSFVLPDVPSPGKYRLIVEKPGSATESRDVVIAPGQQLDDLEISLRPGDGIVEGSITSPTGPLGGALITASDGSTEIQTVSLTEGDVGSFSLRDLAVPAQYTVTVSRDGYTPETQTVTLDQINGSATFSSRLVPSVGSISGGVVLEGAAARGLQVSISGGDISRTTSVVSQGPAAGSYTFGGLPAPATYTLTYSGSDTIPQVRVIDLDPATGRQDVSGITINLSSERTVVRGLVRDADRNLQGQATVVLSDGSRVFTFLTADDPLGAFEFSNVLPGAYTLTASRSGTDPRVVLVNVLATEATSALDITLGRTAGILGAVVGVNGTADFDPSVQTLQVRLYDARLFPSGDPKATTFTDANGNYVFDDVDAPENWIVAIFRDATARDAIDSQVVVTEPSVKTSANVFQIVLAPEATAGSGDPAEGLTALPSAPPGAATVEPTP